MAGAETGGSAAAKTVPTINESEPGFAQKMVDYYKPPAPPTLANIAAPNDPLVSQADLGQENLNLWIDQGMRAYNAEQWREYGNRIHAWNVESDLNALPAPPVYQVVNVAEFWTWWDDWAKTSFAGSQPPPVFMHAWQQPPRPKIVTQLAIPPLAAFTGPIGAVISPGEAFRSTPIGDLMPIGAREPEPRSGTGFVQHYVYNTPFMPVPFHYWLACLPPLFPEPSLLAPPGVSSSTSAAKSA